MKVNFEDFTPRGGQDDCESEGQVLVRMNHWLEHSEVNVLNIETLKTGINRSFSGFRIWYHFPCYRSTI